jgi:hypothetical protein
MKTTDEENQTVEEAINELVAGVFKQLESTVVSVVAKSLKEKDFSIMKRFVSIMSFIGDCHDPKVDCSAVLLLCENYPQKNASVVSMSGLNISEQDTENMIQFVSRGISDSKTQQNPEMMN